MRAGDVLADRFAIERHAAKGGMGSVWRARDRDGTPVAIKVLKGDSEPGHLARFAREAQILAELEHPHIVRYIAHGTTASGAPFLAMEWLDGEDLEARLAREGIGGREALALVKRVASALSAAHERGIVHRDVKPSNLFLPAGRIEDVKLLDFGIARLGDAARRMTNTGALIGTLGYMAPEQAAGEPDIDARADVYALGCVLFECFAGRRVFVGDQPVVLLAKLQLNAAPRLADLRPDVSPGVDQLVARMLSRAREGRPRDAGEVARALQALPEAASLAPIVSTSVASLTAEERRLVTVLLVGRSADLGPTELAVVGAIAKRHGARLDERGPDEAPVIVVEEGSSADRVAEAARCALTIRRALSTATMAIATGPAVTAPQPRLGELVTRANELLARATVEDATIRLDEASESLLRRRFDVERTDDGVATLQGEHDLAAAPLPLLGKATPIFGRERELASLEGLYDDCVSEPVARVALLTGPAGIGKTRLRQELVAKLLARESPPAIWAARAARSTKDVRLSVIADAVRRARGTDSDVRAASTRPEGLAAMLGRLALVGGPAATSSDARTSDDELAGAFVTVARSKAQEGPLVLVVEGYQWADAASVRAIAATVKALRGLPFFVLVAARTEGAERLGKALDIDALEIRLGPVGRRACERFVTHALGPSTPAAVATRLAEQSQGNPLCVEELLVAEALRALDADWRAGAAFSEPAAPSDSGVARAAPTSSREAPPDAVLAIAQEQLDTLEPEARRVLRAASVFGDSFTATGVAALLRGALGEDAVRALLEELERSGLVARRAVQVDGAEIALEVSRPLLREAAYASLTTADRSLARRLADAWRENRSGEPIISAEATTGPFGEPGTRR